MLLPVGLKQKQRDLLGAAEWKSTQWKDTSCSSCFSDSDLSVSSLDPHKCILFVKASWIRYLPKQRTGRRIYRQSDANKPNITLNCPLLTAAFNYAASLEEQQVAVTKLHSKKLIWWNSELQKCDVDVKPPFLFVVASFTLNTWKLFRCTVCNYYRYFFMIMWLE